MIHLYFGDGKGKTTAAMGLALRTAGRGGGVVAAQFLKGADSGERAALARLPGVTLLGAPERVKFTFQMTPAEREAEAGRSLALLEEAARLARSPDCRLLVLDEALDAVNAGLLPLAAVLGHLQSRREAAPDIPAAELFTGALHNRLGRMVVRYAALEPAKPLASLADAELSRAAASAKCFVLPVRGTEGFANAQVTAGGIKTAEFDPKTLESRLVPGLFACGEVLDIDGDCGGYNLQWAWASGCLAGRLGS